MKTVSPLESFNAFYKEGSLATGDSVTFSVWKQDGTQLVNNQPAQVEIPNTGVYYYNITAPNENTYLLIYATDGEKPSVQVVQVGLPSSRVWYWGGSNVGGDTVPYHAFDYSSQFESGSMADLSNGFYYVDSSAWSLPWFVNIDDIIIAKNP